MQIVWLPTAVAAESCTFKQYSPWFKTWFLACEMPTTKESCTEKRMSPYQGATRFSGTSCDLKGVTAACYIRGRTVYFYGASPKELEAGCPRMGGVTKAVDDIKAN